MVVWEVGTVDITCSLIRTLILRSELFHGVFDCGSTDLVNVGRHSLPKFKCQRGWNVRL